MKPPWASIPFLSQLDHDDVQTLLQPAGLRLDRLESLIQDATQVLAPMFQGRRRLDRPLDASLDVVRKFSEGIDQGGRSQLGLGRPLQEELQRHRISLGYPGHNM